MSNITKDIDGPDFMGNNRPALANMQRALLNTAIMIGRSTQTFTAPANMFGVTRVTEDDFSITTLTRATDANFEDLAGLCLFDEGGSTSVATNEVVIVVQSGFININTSFAAGDYLWLHDSTAGAFQNTPIVGQPPIAKVLVTGATGLMIYNRRGIQRLLQDTRIVSVRIGGLAASDDRYLMAGPFGNCRITQAYLISDTATVSSDGTDNWTFQIENLTQTLDLLATAKTTNGAEIPANAVYDLGPDQNQTIAANDVLELQIVKNNAPTDLGPAEIQVVVEFQAI